MTARERSGVSAGESPSGKGAGAPPFVKGVIIGYWIIDRYIQI